MLKDDNFNENKLKTCAKSILVESIQRTMLHLTSHK